MPDGEFEGYSPSTYGDRIAGVYDDLYEGLKGGLDTEAAVAFLSELADGGPVLELAIGTGRLALPLSEAGIEVHGIDASQAMVEALRRKPGGDRIPVTVGDFADVDVEEVDYSLIFIVFNTFFALLSQEEQVRCLTNVAAHLRKGGAFVIEAFVPDPNRFDLGQRVSCESLSLEQVQLTATRHDPVEQVVTSQHIVIEKDDVSLYPVKLRYAWPAELDLMARIAGLRLSSRFGGWRREPFTGRSDTHVSVYLRED